MQAIARVIDANINRAKEGLRVIEDICRFVLDDAALTDAVKTIRHTISTLVTIPDFILVNARGSDEDVARERPVPRRSSLRVIATANFKRVAEALRVLEEFSVNGTAFKDERYKVYDLEKVIALRLRKKQPFFVDVYVVHSEPAVLMQAVKDGAAIVQLRDKTSSAEVVYQKSLQLIAFQKEHDFVFIINDDAELVKKVGADGVHIGQDTDTHDVRRIVGEQCIIGKTTHAIAQAVQAEADGADYISAGPVYETPTKPGRPAVGLTYVQEVAARVNIPFVAIGGIDRSNLDQVLAVGARTIGIVRQAPQTTAFLEQIRKVSL